MKNLFEIADRKKYRFPTRKGNASCEDLWDLSLESLDILAGTIDAALLAKNYISKEVKNKEENEDKLAIVQHIIKTKIDERDKPNGYLDIPDKKEEIKPKFL